MTVFLIKVFEVQIKLKSARLYNYVLYVTLQRTFNDDLSPGVHLLTCELTLLSQTALCNITYTVQYAMP